MKNKETILFFIVVNFVTIIAYLRNPKVPRDTV